MRLGDSWGTFVVGVGDGSESFLACSIPYLQFDVFLIRGDCFESEIDADGCHVIFVKLVVGET